MTLFSRLSKCLTLKRNALSKLEENKTKDNALQFINIKNLHQRPCVNHEKQLCASYKKGQ